MASNLPASTSIVKFSRKPPRPTLRNSTRSSTRRTPLSRPPQRKRKKTNPKHRTMATTVKEIDPLDHLEERIQKAVALVHRLRDDNEAAQKSAAEDREIFAMEKADATKVADALRVDLEEAKNTNVRLNAEIASLREERQQVRARLEILLGHIDHLGAA